VVTPDHVEEAKRLFQVSTYQAATASYGGEGIGAEFIEKVRTRHAFVPLLNSLAHCTPMTAGEEMREVYSSPLADRLPHLRDVAG